MSVHLSVVPSLPCLHVALSPQLRKVNLQRQLKMCILLFTNKNLDFILRQYKALLFKANITLIGVSGILFVAYFQL